MLLKSVETMKMTQFSQALLSRMCLRLPSSVSLLLKNLCRGSKKLGTKPILKAV